MTDDANKYLVADIPDPTDFSADAPGLRQLDEALRCTMCRELFQAPVTVNCPHGHCFCSYCIRDAMTIKEECPLCRGPISEVQIRKNPAMEDTVKAWNIARPFVLQILKERADAEAAAVAQVKAEHDVGKPRSKKRKVSSRSSSEDEVVEVGERLASLPNSQASDPSLVKCPICKKKMPMQVINNHLDAECSPSATPGAASPLSPSAKDKGKQKHEWSQLFQGAAPGARRGKGKAGARTLDEQGEPLPKVAYDTVTQKRLREILEEYGLSTTGDRSAMAARHSRFVNMFNANLDASPALRKSVKQLQVEMRRWDEAEEKKRTRKRVDAKDIDPEEYQRENRSTFAKLVQAAKAKAPQKHPVAPSSPPGVDPASSPPPLPKTSPASSRHSSAETREVMVIEDD